MPKEMLLGVFFDHCGLCVERFLQWSHSARLPFDNFEVSSKPRLCLEAGSANILKLRVQGVELSFRNSALPLPEEGTHI